MKTTTALIVVDVQNDFAHPVGKLYVPGGQGVVPEINKLLSSGQYALVCFSQDWHPQGHSSFATWPEHCVYGTWGADLYEGVDKGCSADLPKFIVRKGTEKDTDAYSAFKGTVDLAKILAEAGIKELDICGIATEYCVKATVLDALEAGFKVTVISSACRGLDGHRQALDDMAEKGATII